MSSKYLTLEVLIGTDVPHVAIVRLNRPKVFNAMSMQFFREFKSVVDELSLDGQVRAIVIDSSGKHFSAGLDLRDQENIALFNSSELEIGRRALFLRSQVRVMQDAFTSLERCVKPIICATNGLCIGAGVDLMSACDIRYCAQDSKFSIKEVELALAADLGTLQRFPKIVGNDSIVRELAFTGRMFDSAEALKIGFVGAVYPTKEAVLKAALKTAQDIATKSPVSYRIHFLTYFIEINLFSW